MQLLLYFTCGTVNSMKYSGTTITKKRKPVSADDNADPAHGPTGKKIKLKLL
jgi:hypothetical protein